MGLSRDGVQHETVLYRLPSYHDVLLKVEGRLGRMYVVLWLDSDGVLVDGTVLVSYDDGLVLDCDGLVLDGDGLDGLVTNGYGLVWYGVLSGGVLGVDVILVGGGYLVGEVDDLAYVDTDPDEDGGVREGTGEEVPRRLGWVDSVEGVGGGTAGGRASVEPRSAPHRCAALYFHILLQIWCLPQT